MKTIMERYRARYLCDIQERGERENNISLHGNFVDRRVRADGVLIEAPALWGFVARLDTVSPTVVADIVMLRSFENFNDFVETPLGTTHHNYQPLLQYILDNTDHNPTKIFAPIRNSQKSKMIYTTNVIMANYNIIINQMSWSIRREKVEYTFFVALQHAKWTHFSKVSKSSWWVLGIINWMRRWFQ